MFNKVQVYVRKFSSWLILYYPNKISQRHTGIKNIHLLVSLFTKQLLKSDISLTVVVIKIPPFRHSWLITGNVTRVPWRVPLLEHFLSPCPPFLLHHWIACPSSNHNVCVRLWYLQTFLKCVLEYPWNIALRCLRYNSIK